MKQVVAIVFLMVLASCAPAVQEDAGLQVALINAPAGQRVSFLADELQEALVEVPSRSDFGFIRPAPIRFQETHRDMFGSRAAPQSASLARNLGAEVAVMASAPRFERSVESVEGGSEVRGVVQLQASAIDAESGEPLGTVGSLTFRGSRLADDSEPLPEIEEDPLMISLTRDAVADLAPHLAALLGDLAGQYR